MSVFFYFCLALYNYKLLNKIMMRNLTKSLTLFLFAFLMFSCSNDSNETVSPTLAEKVTQDVKWIDNNPDSKFASFEFNKSGNYIIVENVINRSASEQKTYFGTYKITSDSTIVLSDLGTIKILSATEGTVGLRITLTGTSTVLVFNGSKTENMQATTKTELLCRTWKFVKQNGKTLEGTAYEDGIVLFSKAGTYFTELPYGERGDTEGISAFWKWKSETNESQFLYSWDGSFEDNDYFVTIDVLTNTSLKITDVFEDDGKTYIYVWELIPATNTKSSISQGVKKENGGKGFLGNR